MARALTGCGAASAAPFTPRTNSCQRLRRLSRRIMTGHWGASNLTRYRLNRGPGGCFGGEAHQSPADGKRAEIAKSVWERCVTIAYQST
jgi:hypothetical protein